MNEENLDFTGNTDFTLYSSNNSSSNNMANKRPQVYSNYIQPNLQNENNNSTHKNHQNNQHSNFKNAAFNKKSKLVQEISELEMKINQEFISVQNDSILKSLKNSFIGVNTFQSENIFMDMFQNEIILVKLNNNLKHFCFKGKCSITVIFGHLRINGFDIKADLTQLPKWFDTYSPETNSFLSFSNKLDSNEVSETDLNVEQQIVFLANRIMTVVHSDFNSSQTNQNLREFLSDFSLKTTTLFFVRSFKSQMCNYLSNFNNFQQIYHSFSGIQKEQQNNDFDIKFARLGLYPVPDYNFNAVNIESEEEKNVINEFFNSDDQTNKKSSNFVVMACGGKDVGKSTFLRFWINLLLNKYPTVAYIDCDPGQCEFTLSGCISFNLISEPLFGPPHTHINHKSTNKSCYFLGHLSPSDVPSHYLQCIKKCFEDFVSYKSTLNNNQIIPLIINTMGWNQGLGLCLLKETIIFTKPTHLIQINHPSEANKNMPVLDKQWLQTAEGWSKTPWLESNRNDFSDINYKHISIKSRAPIKSQQHPNLSQKRFTPLDHRNIASIAYLSHLQESKQYQFVSIHHIRPYKVSWSKFGLHVSHQRIQYDQMFRVFNASLVGLCYVDPKFLIQKNENKDFKLLESYDSLKQAPTVYNCLGFGVIRGIDTETREFYILTPEPIDILNQVNLLVKSKLDLPKELLFEQDSETVSPYLNYLSNSQYNTNNDQNLVGHEPFQRKYLIHQPKPGSK